uniref:Uncharacterized protein n=1 Tax=Romanomermis culicivorax TaxID=13658 RepID=A0A915KMA8_ROMCU
VHENSESRQQGLRQWCRKVVNELFYQNGQKAKFCSQCWQQGTMAMEMENVSKPAENRDVQWCFVRRSEGGNDKREEKENWMMMSMEKQGLKMQKIFGASLCAVNEYNIPIHIFDPSAKDFSSNSTITYGIFLETFETLMISDATISNGATGRIVHSGRGS